MAAGEQVEDLEPIARLVVLGERPFKGQGGTLREDTDRAGLHPRREIVGEAVRLLVVPDDRDQRRQVWHGATSSRQVGGSSRGRDAKRRCSLGRKVSGELG